MISYSIYPSLLFVLLLLVQFLSKSMSWTTAPHSSVAVMPRGSQRSSLPTILLRRCHQASGRIRHDDTFSTITKLHKSANNENTSNNKQQQSPPLSARAAATTRTSASVSTITATAATKTATISEIPRLSALLLNNRTDDNNDNDREEHEEAEPYSIQQREYDVLISNNDDEPVPLLVVATATLAITVLLAACFASSSFSQGDEVVSSSSSSISTTALADFVNTFITSAQDVFRDPSQALDDVVKVVDSMGSTGIVYFGIAYCIAEILAIPAIPLTASAGYLFGPVTGTAVVLFSASIAAAVSFQIGRTLLRDYVEGVLVDYPKFRKLDKAIGREGFRLMLLLRLSPIFPFALSNYLYGASSINFGAFFMGTVLGFAPGTIAYVYTGYVGKALTMTGTTDGAVADTVYPWYVYLTGLSLFAALLKIVADTATRVVEEIEAEEEAVAETEEIIKPQDKNSSSFF